MTGYRDTSKDFFGLGRLPEQPRADLPGTGARTGRSALKKRIRHEYRLAKDKAEPGTEFPSLRAWMASRNEGES